MKVSAYAIKFETLHSRELRIFRSLVQIHFCCVYERSNEQCINTVAKQLFSLFVFIVPKYGFHETNGCLSKLMNTFYMHVTKSSTSIENIFTMIANFITVKLDCFTKTVRNEMTRIAK